ncbi:hypothetical protein NLM33_33075 [Bradyrhizobium sp. CCGUVB1N3]|uniref:hypothetical protein n=1 Tax=Bradyrhizobium sp. CCGUVB1N3 TaxID=2949629 RepID=UPI0020B283AD|nr:hypothetical protein [Bradyrhizobium sp. CCGUVB1N3]MCP3475159.1 hypothetical protein [Bradyrhizobium sp. CCGUVB1N3]
MQYNQPLDQPSNPNAPYIDGNPAAGIQGSIVPAASIEYDQREVIEVITRANVRGYFDFSNTPCAIPANSDLTQLRKAIEGFITSQSWIIDKVLTKTVHGPGADFADLNAAIYWLSHYRITTKGFVHFNIAGATSGTAQMFTYTQTVNLIHPDLLYTDWNGAPLIGAPPNVNDFQFTGFSNRTVDANAHLAMLRTRLGTELRFVTGAQFNIGSSTSLRTLLISNDGSTVQLLVLNGGIPGLYNMAVHGAQAFGIVLNMCNAWTSGTWVSASGTVNGDAWELQGDLSLAATQTIGAGSAHGITMQPGTCIRQGGAFKWVSKGCDTGVVMITGSSASLQGCMFQNCGTGISCDSSFANAYSSSYSGNTTDIYCAHSGHVVAVGGTGITSTSPALNALGNANGMISY